MYISFEHMCFSTALTRPPTNAVERRTGGGQGAGLGAQTLHCGGTRWYWGRHLHQRCTAALCGLAGMAVTAHRCPECLYPMTGGAPVLRRPGYGGFLDHRPECFPSTLRLPPPDLRAGTAGSPPDTARVTGYSKRRLAHTVQNRD